MTLRQMFATGLTDWLTELHYARIEVWAQLLVGQPVLETITNTYTRV